MHHEALRGRRALITGASGGIGAAVARALAPLVDVMMLTGRSEARLSAIAAELRGAHPARVCTHAADLADDAELDGLIGATSAALGGVDLLVLAAGVFPRAVLEDATRASFDACFAINVRAPFALAAALVPAMARAGFGRVLNVGSSSAYAGFRGTSVYCASKHALLGLSRALHDEFKGRGVRVLSVSPGSVDTEMGRLATGQDFSTFIAPEDVATFAVDAMAYDGQMVVDEVRLNRMEIR